MNRRSFLQSTSTADGAAAAGSKLSTLGIGQSVQAGPTFRRPKIILPVPTPEAKFQHVEDGVPDTQLTREAGVRPGRQPVNIGLCLGFGCGTEAV
jgi:hypothetical protein